MINNSPIVIDNKPDYIRAGLSSGDTPTVVFPTNSITSTPAMGQDGVVTNWDSMIAIWSHTFKQLGIEPSEHPILVTEPPLNPKLNKEKITEIFFDKFNVPNLYIGMGEILALYDVGKTTGVAVNLTSNGRFLVVVPSYEGFSFPHVITIVSLDEYPSNDLKIGKMADTVYSSIMRSDVDIRSKLYENIVLTGSSSIFPGLTTKLQYEVSKLAPVNKTVKVFEPTEPENGAWRGGDKLVPLLNNYGSWMSKEEYAKYGAIFAHRKFTS